jgi:hypothetical protein
VQISDKWHHLVYLPSLKEKKVVPLELLLLLLLLKKIVFLLQLFPAQENSLSAAAVAVAATRLS